MATTAGLLHCPEEEFDRAIKHLEIQGLVETILRLQKEMAAEQEKFDQLSAKMAAIQDSGSPEYAELSEELLACQNQLTQLMNRNMKCFSQQTASDNTELLCGLTEQTSGLESSQNTGPDADTTDLPSQQVKPVTAQSSQATKPRTALTNGQSPVRQQQSPRLNGVSPGPPPSRHQQNEVPVVISQTTVMLKSSPVSTEARTNGSGTNVPVNGFHKNEDSNEGEPSEEKWKPGFTRNAVAQFENLAKAGDKSQDMRKVTLGTSSRNVIYDSRRPEGVKPKQKDQGTSKLNKLNELRSKVQGTQNTDSRSKSIPDTKVEVKKSSVTMMISPGRVSPQQLSSPEQPSSPTGRPSSPRRSPSPVQLETGTYSSTLGLNPVRTVKPAVMGRTRSPSPQDTQEAPRGWYINTTNTDSGNVGQAAPQPHTDLPDHRAPKPRTHQTDRPVHADRSSPNPPSDQVDTSSPSSDMDTISRRSVAERIQEYSVQQREMEVNDHQAGRVTTHTSINVSRPTVKPSAGTGNETSNKKTENRVTMVTETDHILPTAPGSGILPPAFTPSEGFTADEKVKDRVTLKSWDPTKLLQDLYTVQLQPEPEEPAQRYVDMEGYLEKLPINKKKATLLKTWKRRYFRASKGTLYYYEEEEGPDTVHNAGHVGDEKPSGEVQLMGGAVDDLEDRMIGIDDGRGHYLTLRCPTDHEHQDWKEALESQTVDNSRAVYVKPVLKSPPNLAKRVVLVDLGSCSVRAGILGDKPSLPQVFFPCVMAVHRDTGRKVFGADAFRPDVRESSHIVYPVQTSVQVDKFSINMEVVPELLAKVFKELGVDPRIHWVMVSAPGNLSDKIKEQLMDVLVKRFGVLGVNIVNQTLLALYSYGAKSGIMVDIGERLEIVPITDGYIVDGGMSRQPYGGHRVAEALNSGLTELKYRFFSEVEFLLVRYTLEKSGFISENYKEDMKKKPETFREVVDLTNYDLPDGACKHITHDQSRFKSTEGLFNLEIWGMDNLPLHKSIQRAVHACPMDTRREMWRSVYLSGGVTMLPGFPERLQQELVKLAPPSIKVQVHASPQRYHAAYVGACTLAALQEFQTACITAEEWRRNGPRTLRKWHSY